MPKASKMMSYNRFCQIKKYLHYCDEEIAVNDRKHPDYDKLYKIRFLLDNLSPKFAAEYIPDQDVSVDECMIPFRGRWSGKCYDKSKPIRWGVKTWMLCCGTTGYAYNLDVYCGRDQDFDDLSTVNNSAAIVIKLCQSLWGKGYHVLTDRFYTSPNLLHWLRQLGLSGTGTCMTNRKGFPKAIVKSAPEARRLDQGDSEWLQCQTTGITATRWTDKKPIYFVSNLAAPRSSTELTVTRHNKKGDSLDVPAPPCVVLYNKFMGGVDLNDKMARLDRSRKSYKWYTRIDRKCVTWSLYNAYVLYKHGLRKPMEYRDFMLNVLTALVGEDPVKRSVSTPRPATANPDIRFNRDILHCPTWPENGSTNHRCEVCEKRYKLDVKQNPNIPYKDRKYKSVKTSVYCDQCSVYLCVKRGSTCFADYHNKVQYWR